MRHPPADARPDPPRGTAAAGARSLPRRLLRPSIPLGRPRSKPGP